MMTPNNKPAHEIGLGSVKATHLGHSAVYCGADCERRLHFSFDSSDTDSSDLVRERFVAHRIAVAN